MVHGNSKEAGKNLKGRFLTSSASLCPLGRHGPPGLAETGQEGRKAPSGIGAPA